MFIRKVRTCSTCKHWGQLPWYLDYQDGLLRQESIRETGKNKSCGSPNIVDASASKHEQTEALPLNAAWYSDCENYAAVFRTGPDFGCVHHEPNEELSRRIAEQSERVRASSAELDSRD